MPGLAEAACMGRRQEGEPGSQVQLEIQDWPWACNRPAVVGLEGWPVL